MTSKEKPFGSWNIGAEMAIAMGADPRPHMTRQQIQKQLEITGMTEDEWNQAFDEKLAKSQKVPF